MSSPQEAEENFERILDHIVEDPEFAPYSEYASVAAGVCRSSKTSTVALVVRAAQEYSSSRETLVVKALRMERSFQVNVRVAIFLGLVCSVLMSSAGEVTLAGGSSIARVIATLAGMGLLSGAGFAVAVATSRGARDDMLEARDALSSFDERIRSDSRNIIQSKILVDFSNSLQRELSERGLIRIPARAPRLVELSDELIVTSRSINRVWNFITSHDTSAIGIAGPRGAGKSTLLHAVASRVRAQGGVAAVISAPVEYSAVDLLRSLAVSVREQLSTESPQEGPRRRIGVWVGAISALAGSGIIAQASFPAAFAEAWPILESVVPLLAGASLILGGLSFVIRPIASDVPSVDGLASLDRLIENIQFETTRAGGLAARGLAFGELSLSKSVVRRTMTQGDVVADLRDALRLIASGGERRVVIAVDELDKLPTHDAVVRVINVLKDLVRIPGVHVLVTVSDEALASFSLGTFERDAFDSTFDVVLEVERLSLVDARDIITARVIGFPDSLLAYCLVSSAGLPRDLIREARAIIDWTAEVRPVPPWEDIARSVVFERAQDAMSTYTRMGVDLAQIPVWTAALERLRTDPDDLLSTELPGSMNEELSRNFSRTVISLAVIKWLSQGGDATVGATPLRQLRDTMLLASRRGGANIALRNLREILIH